MNMKSLIVLLAAMTFALNSIGCADGKSQKSRIAAGAVKAKTGDPASDANKSGAANDGAAGAGTSGGETAPENNPPVDGKDQNSTFTFEQSVADKIDDAYTDQILDGKKVITKLDLAGKKLSLSRVVLKVTSGSSTTAEDNLAAISAYDIDDKGVVLSSTIKADATGSKALTLLTLPTALTMNFDKDGKLEASADIQVMDLKAAITKEGLVLLDQNSAVSVDHFLEASTQILTQESEVLPSTNGGYEFISNMGHKSEGTVFLYQGATEITLAIEVQVDVFTVQIFALTYSVK